MANGPEIKFGNLDDPNNWDTKRRLNIPLGRVISGRCLVYEPDFPNMIFDLQTQTLKTEVCTYEGREPTDSGLYSVQLVDGRRAIMFEAGIFNTLGLAIKNTNRELEKRHLPLLPELDIQP